MDSSTSFDHTAVGQHEFHSDHRSAWTAIAELLSAAETSGDHAAESCTTVVRRIERQPLTVLFELRVEVDEFDTRLRDRD